jgi:SAM-dependent methyltransferase
MAVRRAERTVLAIRALDRRLERDHAMFDAPHAGLWTTGPRLYGGLHRRIARDVLERAPQPHAAVLDIGTGAGDLPLLIRARSSTLDVVGIEPSRALASVARERGADVVEGRAESLPFGDGSFDLVVSSLSVHHWDDPVSAFAEIRRVLRPGGEGRLYDVRFGGLTEREVRSVAERSGLPRRAVDRRVLDERVLGVRPYSLVTIHP